MFLACVHARLGTMTLEQSEDRLQSLHLHTIATAVLLLVIIIIKDVADFLILNFSKGIDSAAI